MREFKLMLHRVRRKLLNLLLWNEHYIHIRNKYIFYKMEKKHKKLLQQIKGKEKIKVVFLAIHKSVWKVDPVFQKMLADPFFEPIILVCPYTPYGEERMWQDMKECYEYFEQKGYPLLSAYNKEEQRWLTLEEIQPDIVFFTNPHNLTRKEYYEDAYLNYLSCYVPYHHEVVNNSEQFNQMFHVAQWKIFASNDSALELYKSLSEAKGKNVIVTGYPAMEVLLENLESNSKCSDSWKTNDGRLKVIWAPHHSVEQSKVTPYANFLTHAELFQSLSKKYKERIIWSFKPHPLLKHKLLQHPDWGITKTNEYYEYWRKQDFTQLDEGEYIDLFCASDAMIHDSGSFLAEYLYVKKPVLYNVSAINTGQYYSEFGYQALNACSLAYNNEDINTFIIELLNGKEIKKEQIEFLEGNVNNFFTDSQPSDNIVKSITEDLLP